MGNTPIIKEYLSRDHLSAISGITPDGKLSMMVQPKAFKSAHVKAGVEEERRKVEQLAEEVGPSVS